MFTGLVEEVGECLWLRRTSKAIQLTILAEDVLHGLRTGDSIAVNGCCLTAGAHRKGQITFDILQETLDRTNLGALRPGAKVNLERALAANGRLGGHFVQGHIDGTLIVKSVGERGPDLKLTCELPEEFARYVAWKGSIALNGVSLTVAELGESSLAAWLIPQTRTKTNLGSISPGARVNAEFDILAKYAERILHPRGGSARPTPPPRQS